MNEHYFDNHYSVQSTSINARDVDSLAVEIDCETTDTDEDGLVETAAKAKLILCNTNLFEDCESWAEILDTHDELDIFQRIINPDANFLSDRAMGLLYPDGSCGFATFNNILVLTKIEVAPKFRGNNLIKIIIEDVLRIFGGNCQLVAAHASPLQLTQRVAVADEEKEWDKGMNYNAFSKDRDKSRSKLIDQYKKAGFQQFDDDIVLMANPYY